MKIVLLVVLLFSVLGLKAQTIPPHIDEYDNVKILGNAGNEMIFFGRLKSGNAPHIVSYDGTNLQILEQDSAAVGYLEKSELIPLNGKYYFFNLVNLGSFNFKPALWVTDGTANGTYVVKELNAPSYVGVSSWTVRDGKLYFVYQDQNSGRELFVSDGTTSGTMLTAESVAGTSGMSTAESKLIFTCTHGVYFSSNGVLWKNDGTSTNAVTPSVTNAQLAGVFEDEVYYLNSGNIKKFDGTNVTDITGGYRMEQPYIFNGDLYAYVKDNASNGSGTYGIYRLVAGTTNFSLFDPNLTSSVSTPINFCRVGNQLVYMNMHNYGQGNAFYLYTTDGLPSNIICLDSTLLISHNQGIGTTRVADDRLYLSPDPMTNDVFVTDGLTTPTYIGELDNTTTLTTSSDYTFLNGNVYCASNELFCVTCQTNGLKEMQNTLTKVYPVPTSEYLTVEREGQAELTLVDMNGKVIIQLQHNNQSFISVKGLQTGVYLLSVKSEKEVQLVRVIVE